MFMDRQVSPELLIKEAIRLPDFVSQWLSGTGSSPFKPEQYYLENKKKLIWKYTPAISNMGPPRYCHGGFLATVLDECMGSCAIWQGYYLMAASLQVRYKQSAPVNGSYYCISRTEKKEGRRFSMAGKIIDRDNKVYSTATGIYLSVPVEKLKNPPAALLKISPLKGLLGKGYSLSDALKKLALL